MSDRLAVFNHGRIEQIGAPAEVYEAPKSSFVAGFVGTSNIIEGALAQRLSGQAGRFSLRPEKIHLGAVNAQPLADSITAEGAVRDVVYLGLYTRYLVTLDSGEDLIVSQQNLSTNSSEVAAAKGQRVKLQWLKSHMLQLA